MMAWIDEDKTRRELVERALRDAKWPILDYSKGKRYRIATAREFETGLWHFSVQPALVLESTSVGVL